MNARELILLGVLMLAGCASVPGTAPVGPPDEAAWHVRRAQLEKLVNWKLQGRVGIVNGQNGGSGSMDWTQRGNILDFSFHGPFGAGALKVRGDANVLWVRSSRGDDFITTDPERDFVRRLHVPLPVLSLRYWMMGIPDPNASFARTVDDRGHLVTLTQRGWQVDYRDYARFDGYDLPTRMLLRRDRVRIKIAINAWHVFAHPGDQPATVQ